MKKIIYLLFVFAAFSCSTRFDTFHNVPEFKFSIIRSFHKPLYFQTEKDSNSTWLTVRIYSGQGEGDNKGKIESTQRFKLDTNQTKTIVELLNRLDLKRLKQSEKTFGFDGSTWKLQISPDTTYSFSRWTPIDNTKHRKLVNLVNFGRYMWTIGNIKEPDKDFY